MPSRAKRSSRSSSSSRSRSAGTKSRSSSRGTSRATSSRSRSARSGSSRSASASSRSRSAGSRSRATASRARSTGSSRRSAGSRPLVDHDEIQQWAEERGARPACVRGTGSGGEDVGMIRLDFPGYGGEQSLEHIEWDEWFQKFDESGLALLVQNKTARGQKSNFNKLVSRETASGGRSSSKRKSPSGSRGASSRKRAA